MIVDEAQDLHETQWRLLRAVVAEQPNDLFIVGDSHQRIYDRRSSLSKVGINIRGRSSRLRVNYRTTHEILRWAMALLGEHTYDDLDDGTDPDTIGQYHSFLHGAVPELAGYPSLQEELAALGARVRGWISDGIDPNDIGVTARRHENLEAARVAIEAAGHRAVILGQRLPLADGVRLGTMHRLKGLEFRAVAVIDADDLRLPDSAALTPRSDDEVQHGHDLDRERSLFYVSATRAREHLWISWSGKPSRFLGPMLGD